MVIQHYGHPLYCATIGAPGLRMWTQIEWPLVMILSRMICSKEFTPHKIVCSEVAALCILVEILFTKMSLISWIQRMPEASKQNTRKDHSTSSHNIGNLPPFQYCKTLQMMNRTRCCGKIYDSSISRRLGSHQRRLFPQRWPTTKSIHEPLRI